MMDWIVQTFRELWTCAKERRAGKKQSKQLMLKTRRIVQSQIRRLTKLKAEIADFLDFMKNGGTQQFSTHCALDPRGLARLHDQLEKDDADRELLTCLLCNIEKLEGIEQRLQDHCTDKFSDPFRPTQCEKHPS